LGEKRKLEHIKICLERNVEAEYTKTGFEEIYLVHRCLPELNLDEVSTETFFLGEKFNAPLVISAITGGPRLSTIINRSLAEAAQELNIILELGSQRPALEDPSLLASFKVVREVAPDAYVVANLGAVQLVERGVEYVKQAVDMVDADAVAIHLNPLQEAIQLEGEARFRGVAEALKQLTRELNLPVIVKETGCGVAGEEARLCAELGVSAIDVAGAGGTSWGAIEGYRALEAGDHMKFSLGMKFRDWGIPTAISILETKHHSKLPIIASGGVRSGVDVAKALALGADMAGMALPLLRPALIGSWAVTSRLSEVVEELRLAMFLTGSKSVEELKEADVVITGRTAEWLRARGLELSTFAKRRSTYARR